MADAGKKQLFIGLMSGTSLNSIDCGLFRFGLNKPKVIATREHPLPPSLKNEILNLCSEGENEIHRMSIADRLIGEVFAEAVIALLKDSGHSANEITALGCHGQTIRHKPSSAPFEPSYSLQIGDPNTIASITNIATVSDFRRRDIALGGQGAPLAPAFHAYAFKNKNENRIIANIGGISNITWLPKRGSNLGFDTGPGNILMDLWIRREKGLEFDRNGAWASTGAVIAPFLQELLDETYLSLPPPKSTGRELFNEQWLLQKLPSQTTLAPQDVMATLTEYTALTIAQGLESACSDGDSFYICGGGAQNSFLVSRMQTHLGSIPVSTTEPLGIHPDWVEAATFAWLAKNALAGKKIDFSSITGSSRPVLCGGIYSV